MKSELGLPRRLTVQRYYETRHTVGSGKGGCNLNLPTLQDRPLLGSALALGYQAVGRFSRPPLQRKTKYSSHCGLPRTLEPPLSSPAQGPGTQRPPPFYPSRSRSLRPGHFRELPGTSPADSGSEDLSRKIRPCVWRKWLCV